MFKLLHLFSNPILLLPIRTTSQHYMFDAKQIISESKIWGLKSFTRRKYYVSLKTFSTSFQLLKEEITKLDESESLLIDPDFISVTNRLYRHPGMGHNILLIQPRPKSGPKREKKEESECKLAEAVSLVHTLPHWKVIEKHVIPTSKLDSKFMFGSGNLEMIKHTIQKDVRISAVFIGINILTALQNTTLEEHLNVPVFDRYQIILQIFHDHAHTRDAKLQLALAEIPYLRVKLAGYYHTRDATHFSGLHHIGGDGETFMEKRKRLLNERELKLKKALDKLKNQRQFLRSSERRSALPIIAVVGYTNCGKTTLIKALTDDARLLPQDKLFATLDVTLHAGLLPSNQKVLFIDTVGFISDVPTSLIQSFRSTLEEVALADLVIHVRDISHPDTEKQKKTVEKTLQELDLPQKLMDSILEVKNKVDLVESIPDADTDAAYISAKKGTGLSSFLEKVEQKLFENTGHSVSLLRIPNGGEEYSWLMKEGGIRDYVVDAQDSGYLIVEVVLSSAHLAKFKHIFGDLTVSIEDVINKSL